MLLYWFYVVLMLTWAVFVAHVSGPAEARIAEVAVGQLEHPIIAQWPGLHHGLHALFTVVTLQPVVVLLHLLLVKLVLLRIQSYSHRLLRVFVILLVAPVFGGTSLFSAARDVGHRNGGGGSELLLWWHDRSVSSCREDRRCRADPFHNDQVGVQLGPSVHLTGNWRQIRGRRVTILETQIFWRRNTSLRGFFSCSFRPF